MSAAVGGLVVVVVELVVVRAVVEVVVVDDVVLVEAVIGPKSTSRTGHVVLSLVVLKVESKMVSKAPDGAFSAESLSRQP